MVHAAESDAVVAQFFQELGLLVEGEPAAAGAVVEGVEGPGGRRGRVRRGR